MCRQEDLSSVPVTRHIMFKSSGVICTWNPRDGEVETGRFLGLTDWLVLPCWCASGSGGDPVSKI